MTPPRGERQYSPIHTPSPAAAGDGQTGEEEGGEDEAEITSTFVVVVVVFWG